MAAGGAGMAFIGGLGEAETLGADTPVTVAGGLVATGAGQASTAMGAMAAGLKTYSAGDPRALLAFGAEYTQDRLTQRLLKIEQIEKFLPESAKVTIEKSLGVVYGVTQIKIENPCGK